MDEQWEIASPQEILKHATETFDEKLVVVTSFRPTGIITLHMHQKLVPKTLVITLDIGLFFPETYALIDEVEVI